MKKSILSTLIGLGLVSGSFAATVTYVNQSAWLGSSAWSAWTHSQTTENFDSYTTRNYFTAGDPDRGTQTSNITSPGGVAYNTSVPANTMSIVRTAGIWDGGLFGAGRTYTQSGIDYSYNPLRVELNNTSAENFGLNAQSGTKFLSFYKNQATDTFRMSFATGVSAVSLFIGDFGDINSGLLVKDQDGNTLWNDSGTTSLTYGGQTMVTGDGVWAFLGFTTDNPNGFSYLDFTLTGNDSDNIGIDTVRFNTVPEPSAGALLVLGVGGIVALRRTRRSRE